MEFLRANFSARCLDRRIIGMDPRGGATISLVRDRLVIFGGADREQCHFSDIWVLESGSRWRKIECSGDTPMPRSGHSVVPFGNKYLLLFGGIDFTENAVYNDLYALNTETWEWSYIGESGAEICGRNSHLCGIILDGDVNGAHDSYLVIHGGASPEHGTLSDTYLAKLPRPEDIADIKELYVTWIALPEISADSGPGSREMQAGCVSGSTMYMFGGRRESGEILSDCWALSFEQSVPATDTTSTDNAGSGIAASVAPSSDAATPITRLPSWKRRVELDIAQPLCSHVVGCSADGTLVIFGGFNGVSVSESVYCANVSTGTGNRMHEATLSATVESRFGACVCSAPSWLFTSRERADVAPAGIVLFGGVNAEHDLNDFWLLYKLAAAV